MLVFCCWVLWVLCIFWVLTPYWIYDLQIFSLMNCLFTLWYPLKHTFDEVQFIFSFFSHAFGVISKNLLHNSRLWRFTSMFSSKSLWSHIYVFDPFWINFRILCEVRVQLHSCACAYPVFSAPFVEKTILFLSNDLGILAKNSTGRRNRDLFLDSEFYSIDPFLCFSASNTIFLLLWLRGRASSTSRAGLPTFISLWK